MEKIDLNQLIGQKMEPRYLEYNWRDVALYNLAVGPTRRTCPTTMKST